MAEIDSENTQEIGGVPEGGIISATPTHTSGPAQPCTVCGGVTRWNDAGIWRCVACWPPEATQEPGHAS